MSAAERDAWFANWRAWGRRYPPNARYAIEIPMAISPDMRGVWRACTSLGNWTEPDLYIVAANDCDAWEEVAEWAYLRDGACDHGGEITDEQRFLTVCGESTDGVCDCDQTSGGHFVNLTDYHLQQMALPVEMFLLAFPLETGSETM